MAQKTLRLTIDQNSRATTDLYTEGNERWKKVRKREKEEVEVTAQKSGNGQ